MKVLHIADRHGRDRDAEQIEKIDTFIAETAEREHVALAVLAGDIFDSYEVKAGSVSALQAITFVERLADVCPVVIIKGTTRHDGNAPGILAHVRGEFPVLFVDRPTQILLEGGKFGPVERNEKWGQDPDAIISLIPTITKQYFTAPDGASIEETDKLIASEMNNIFMAFGAGAAEYPDVPHIMIWHGGVSGAKIPSGHVLTGADIEISTKQMLLAGGDHRFLGAFYPGPVYPVKVDEQECGFFIHDVENKDFIAMLGHIHQRQRLGGEGDGSESRWIPTPITRTLRFQFDLTAGEVVSLPGEQCAGAVVRVELKTWADEADKIDKKSMEANILRWGAVEADVRITRVPRENVRSVEVINASTLRDKIVAQAELKGEKVDPGILELADRLEHTPAEMLLKQAQEGRL